MSSLTRFILSLSLLSFAVGIKPEKHICALVVSKRCSASSLTSLTSPDFFFRKSSIPVWMYIQSGLSRLIVLLSFFDLLRRSLNPVALKVWTLNW